MENQVASSSFVEIVAHVVPTCCKLHERSGISMPLSNTFARPVFRKLPRTKARLCCDSLERPESPLQGAALVEGNLFWSRQLAAVHSTQVATQTDNGPHNKQL